MNIERRIKEVFLFYLLKKAERHAAQAPALRERHPQFVNRHSSFHEISYEMSGFGFQEGNSLTPDTMYETTQNQKSEPQNIEYRTAELRRVVSLHSIFL